MSVAGDRSDDEYSVIGDKGEIGFIDFEDDKSVCSYDPSEDGEVIISVPYPFVAQKPQSISVDEVAAEAISIRNTTRDSVELWGIQIYASNPEYSFTLSLMEPSAKGFVGASSLEDRVLQPLKTLTIWLSCKPKDIGLHTCIVHFDVGNEKIERVVFLLAEDSISKALASNKQPYQRGRRKSHFVVDSYVAGVRPARTTTQRYRYRLPLYEISKAIREVIESKQVPDAVLGGLSRKNYVDYFKTLLVMEELRMEEDIRAYDMEDVTMKSRGRNYLILEVLGLAERRPSLVHGDSVFARCSSKDADETPVYEDPYWEQLLWRCVDNNSYEGCSLPQRQRSRPTQEWSHGAEQGSFPFPDATAEQGEGSSWEEDKPVNDEGQECSWEEDKPINKGGQQECSWEEDKPVQEGYHGKKNSYEEDKPVKDVNDRQESSWEEFKPVKDEDEWSEGWK